MGLTSRRYVTMTMSAHLSTGIDFMRVSDVTAIATSFFVQTGAPLAAAAAALGSLNKNVFEQWQ